MRKWLPSAWKRSLYSPCFHQSRNFWVRLAEADCRRISLPLFFIGDVLNLLLGGLARGRDREALAELQDLLGHQPDELEEHPQGASLGLLTTAQVAPTHVLDHVRQVDLGVQVPIVSVIDEGGYRAKDSLPGLRHIRGGGLAHLSDHLLDRVEDTAVAGAYSGAFGRLLRVHGFEQPIYFSQGLTAHGLTRGLGDAASLSEHGEHVLLQTFFRLARLHVADVPGAILEGRYDIVGGQGADREGVWKTDEVVAVKIAGDIHDLDVFGSDACQPGYLFG